jgi:hypothetical protein
VRLDHVPKQDTLTFGMPIELIDDGVETEMDDLAGREVECDEPDELVELVLESDDDWDQQMNSYLREADDEIQRQIDQELDDAIQNELDKHLEEQMNTYFQRQQQIQDDNEIFLDMGRRLGFAAQSPAPPVTVADVEATIQQVVQAYMAKGQHQQFPSIVTAPNS